MLVRKIDKSWVPFFGEDEFEHIETTALLTYGDGRTETVEVKPYPVKRTLNSAGVEAALASGAWTKDDLAAVGLAVPIPFTAPEGKVAVGEPRYVEKKKGEVREEYSVEDIPPPPPEPSLADKFDRMLAASGISAQEFAAEMARRMAEQQE